MRQVEEWLVVSAKGKNDEYLVVHNDNAPADQAQVLSQLESDLEWFLTWRLKLAGPPTIMWCDGVRELSIQPRGEQSYEAKASAWLGPEADVNKTTLCKVHGTIVLDGNRDGLRSYLLALDYEGQNYILTDAI